MSMFDVLKTNSRDTRRNFLWETAPVMVLVASFAGAIGLLWHFSRVSTEAVESAAIRTAKQHAEIIEDFRTLYTAKVCEPASRAGLEISHDFTKNNVLPLPITLSMLFAEEVGAGKDSHQTRIYSDYPFPWRKDGGPLDAFERDALDQLRENPNQDYFSFEDFQGRPSLRYARADLMRASCVSCHNNYPQSPKTDWKEGDVRGVLEVIVPMDGVVEATNSQLSSTFTWLMLGAVAGLATVVAAIYRWFDRHQHGPSDVVHATHRPAAASQSGSAISRILFGLSWLAIAVTVLIFDLSSPLGIAAGVPYIILVLFSLRSPRWSLTFAAAVVGTVLTLIGLAASPAGGELWSVLTNRCLAILAVWVTAILCIVQQRRTHSEAVASLEHQIAQRENEILLVSKQMAEQANLSKSEFLANMSHEIRTPMTAILGFSEIVLGNVSEPETVEAITTIRQNGEHLLEIINDILDLSKIEAGKLSVEQIECSPCQIVSSVASLMRVRASAKSLSLEVHYEGPMPERIRSDPTRLRQVLINIVGNAIKFTEVGKIRMVAKLLNADSDDPRLRFDVVDTGIGMTQEQINRLFQPFEQADSSTTRKFGGTGLGLTISKRLAKMLGGNISVTSVAGEGSTFTLDVSTGPLGDVKLVEKPDEAELAQDRSGERGRLESRLDCRVLLAEDGCDNRRLISFILKKAGAEVTTAENGQIAFDLAIHERDDGRPFDVILMDMQMPILDGYDATRKLREAGYVGPILALTAHAMSSDRDKCIAAGCDDYATKPIDRRRLLALIAQYASKYEPCEAGSGAN